MGRVFVVFLTNTNIIRYLFVVMLTCVMVILTNLLISHFGHGQFYKAKVHLTQSNKITVKKTYISIKKTKV